MNVQVYSRMVIHNAECQWFLMYFSLTTISITDSLRVGRSGDRIPVLAIFSAPVQTSPGAHPASYTLGTGFISGVKQPGRGV
jgi:hypothetical protein